VPAIDLKTNYDITFFWYDPNIFPEEEHEKRFEAFKKVCDIE
jgi:predicted adenine nucleotide alpha hydrolase (AANH) superfamily ATPase